MNKNILIQKRIVTYCLIVFSIFLSSWIFRNIVWQPNPEWHIIMEIIASFLAFFTGGMILMRYYNNRNSRSLLLGCGFLISASMGIFNATVASSSFSYLFPSNLSNLFYWSEYASNLFLGLFFFLGEMVSVYERKLRINNSVNEKIVYTLAVLLVIILLDFFTFVSLPTHQPTNFPGYFLLFLPLFFFAGGIFNCLYTGKWKNNDQEYWIILAMLVNLGPQIYPSMYFNSSNAVIILSHLLRIMSSSFMLAGLFITIFSIFKKDRTNEKRIKYILENMKDGIVTVNENCVIESCNLAISYIFGYSADEIVGKTFDILVPHYNTGCARLFLGRKCRIGRYLTSGEDISGKRKTGEIFPLGVDISEINFEGKEVFVLTLRDITQRKEVERLKNEFISVVSHELRTPLTSIRGALGLLTGNAIDLINDDKAKGLIDIAYKNSIRLVNLINDILDIEKIEAGKMDFDEQLYDIMPIIYQSVTLNESYAQQYNVNIAVTQEVNNAKVKIDKDKFMQVMTNLLSNACKFSYSGNTVKIEVFRLNNNIRVSVVDQGPGIPLEFQDKIFQKFVQADSSNTRQKGGTGLGLSICKAIMDKMGGTIGFNSEMNIGSTFYFDLPEFIEYKPAISRVLIFGDDPDMVAVMESVLKNIADVSFANNINLARDMIENNNFDIVILDLELPDSDSLKLLPAISSDKNVTTIIFSAYEVCENITQQVNAVLLKSKTSDQKLLETVQSFIDAKLRPESKSFCEGVK